MARRPLILVLVVFGVLFAASASESRPLTLAGKATFAGLGTSWQEVLQNTGTETIKCMRTFAPPGVTFTNVTGPAGTQNQGTVFSNASLDIAPGASATFTLQTSGPLTSANAPKVNISANCITDAAAEVVISNYPRPPPKVCECKKLTVVAKNYSSSQVNQMPTTLKMTLQWFMGCSAGAFKCKGKLKILPPADSDVKIVTPKPTTVTCNGKCDPNGPTSASGRIPLKVTSLKTLDFDNRAGETIVFPILRFCVRNGKDVFIGQEKLSLVFDAGGFLNKNKSDLNGNRIPDGKEKK